MVYFNIELWIALLPALEFLITSLMIFRKAWNENKKGMTETYRLNLYFAFGFFPQSISYFLTAIRVLFYPPNIEFFMPGYSIAELIFRLAYTSAGIGLPFIMFFGIAVAKGTDFLQEHKWIYILPYIAYVFLIYILWFGITLQPMHYPPDQTLDFTFPLGDPLAMMISLFVMANLIIPSIAFIIHLRNLGRESPHYKRTLVVTVGLLVYTICLMLEGGKFFVSLVIPVRIGSVTGMLILIYGLFILKFKGY